MEFVRNRTFKIWEETNAGGMDNVPPAHCPRAAYVSAYRTAHVERTGGAGTNAISVVGSGGGSMSMAMKTSHGQAQAAWQSVLTQLQLHGEGRAWPLVAAP